jgi:cation:H+ antiporter
VVTRTEARYDPPMPTEPGWIVALVYLGVGFVLLAKGAGWLVGGSTQIARRYGVSTLVVGLTIVAFGTSAPEVVVSTVAAMSGNADISLGNVLGSNIANIGLVLGACAVVLPRVLEERLAPRELLWLFLSLAILWWVCSDAAIERLEGAFMLGVFAVYNVNLLLTARRDAQQIEAVPKRRRPALWIVAGIAAISLGAKLVVDGAEHGASLVGIPASVVGLTVVAIGTSLPELAAGLGGALRGESDISVGNVVGSNVFNLLAVMGIVATLQPLDPGTLPEPAAGDLAATFQRALHEDFWVVLVFSLAAVLLPFVRLLSGRTAGGLLLLAYLGYTVWLYASRT